MDKDTKFDWSTPELIEYGDIARVTTSGKTFFTGDAMGMGQPGWVSGVKPGKKK